MPVPHHSVFTGWMPFLPLIQQHQSTEGIIIKQQSRLIFTGCCKQVCEAVVCMCASAVADAVDARKNPIIIDNTFLQQWERDQYIKLVGKLKYTTSVWCVSMLLSGIFYFTLTECPVATFFGPKLFITTWNKLPLHIHVYLWSPYVIGQTIIFSSCFFFFFFPRLISAVGDWMSTILRHMVWS